MRRGAVARISRGQGAHHSQDMLKAPCRATFICAQILIQRLRRHGGNNATIGTASTGVVISHMVLSFVYR